MTEPTIEQLQGMINFLENDIKQDEKTINQLKGARSFYMKMKIRNQIRLTRKQINHFKDKIKQYESDSFT